MGSIRPRLGAHESIAGGISQAVERGRIAGCEVVQIFNKSNNQWRAAPLRSEEVERFLAIQRETGIKVIVSHASYLINIATPVKELGERSLNSLEEELIRCRRLRIPYLVLHPGSHVGAGVEIGLRLIVERLDRLFSRLEIDEVQLLLETSAGQGNHLGHSFTELAWILDHTRFPQRLGVCLDTCHIFAAGYDLRNREGYEATLAEFQHLIGLEKLKIIHLNDSLRPLGSRKDRHHHIGQGELGLEPFRMLLNDPRLRHIPMILETPKGKELKEDRKNLALLRSLISEK